MTSDPTRLTQLAEWMQGKEGENCEFKEWKNRADYDDMCHYLCALANEGGGKFIIGVTDKRPRRVVGTSAFPQPEQTRKSLCQHVPLAIDFEEIIHPDGRVLVFRVPPRPLGVPVKADGRYWMRKEDSLVEMTEERLKEIFAEAGKDFTAEPCPGLSVTDLDPIAVEDFRRRWAAKMWRAGNAHMADQLGSLSHAQLLADADALTDGQPTYAALILFGTPAAVGRHLAPAEVVFEYRSSDASGPAQERQEYRQGFFAYYDDLWDRINKRNDRQPFQEGLFVLDILTFGERPVREALLNAVSHRNYQLAGSVFVRQFPRRLEIDSPGGFPPGITLENILDRQNPRNRRVAELLTRCGLVERSGQGMNLIYEEQIKESKPTPDWTRTDAHQVGLTLHGTVQDPAFVRFVEQVGQETSRGFTTRDWQTLAAIARTGRVPKALVDRVRRLVDLGLIERDGKGCLLSRKYYEFVGDRPAYTRRKGLDREQNLALLLKHIQDNAAVGSPKEDLLRVLTAVPESTVRSLLRTLQRRGQAHPIGGGSIYRWFPGASDQANSSAVGE